ncbi:nitrogen regulation protein NR(II) [Aestuariibacter sp. AA17]|uniref:Sensory histidine kinase/phosphatase NtrB n=1 Tax=Fluctibacter corallii TaxID=2984329 RepID=A0ABT3A4Y0_9ALTE|nr:nitrogen regulation protein NR(II) [Aestuariibacter sp. AA17]MCV2883736.1 nitrogen regulation protein NR(II) [Aestuariibacter sp. AA17]
MHIETDLDTIFDNLSTAILMVDKDLSIRFANLAAQVMMQISRNQLLELCLPQLFSRECLDYQRLRDTFVNAEGYSDNEAQFAFNDGRFMLVDVTVTALEQSEERLLLLEMKKIDQQKRISQETSQWAQQQAARELIRGLAHEIKNPLGGIRGAAQLLERTMASSEVSEYTSLIIEQSDRLRNLVDRLLGPNSPPDFAWHNIHRTLEKIRKLIVLDDSEKITLHIDYDPSIPEIWMDENMIQQALLNIVRNSMQALKDTTEGGCISLVTRVERQMTIHGKRYPLVCEVKVIDDGPGIPDNLKDTLFYPMTTSKRDGTGLGLSIAQTLINHHRGKIEVDSWPGHTEFSLYLPIDKKEPG